MSTSTSAFRSGYVTILGRPNVGKSTLMNRILGEKISIVSKKPQTTRNRISGIHTTPDCQIIFLDTPGVHKGRDPLNSAMVEAALRTFDDASVILFLVEGNEKPGSGDRYVAQHVCGRGKPVLLGVNKMDLVSRDRRAVALEAYNALGEFDEVFPLSAKDGSGVDALMGSLDGYMQEGPQYFPDDALTDVPERFIAAELVREKCYQLLHQEVPYGIAVVIENFEEGDPVRIDATILVERESQKGIVIGKKGVMMKEVGTLARKDLEDLLAVKVVLKLWVKVKKDWSRNPAILRELGYAE